MDEKVIENAGLTRVEAKIYLALVELGSSLSGEISRKTGVHRRSVYDAIERLIEKGLVSYVVQNNRKYFQPVNPKRLLEIMEEKQERIKNSLPELEAKFKFKKEKRETTFYRGKLGLKSIFEDQLREGKEARILGAVKDPGEFINYYFSHFDKKRLEKKIRLKMIFNESLKKKTKYKLSEIKYLPKKYESQTTTEIYGNKVAIIVWSKEPIAILIEQKEIADSYRKYFDFIWDSI